MAKRKSAVRKRIKKSAVRKSAVRKRIKKSAVRKSAVRKTRSSGSNRTWTETTIYSIVIKGRSYHEISYSEEAGWTNWTKVLAYFPTIEERDAAYKFLTLRVIRTCCLYKNAHTRSKKTMRVLRSGDKWLNNWPSNGYAWKDFTKMFNYPDEPALPHIIDDLLKNIKEEPVVE